MPSDALEQLPKPVAFAFEVEKMLLQRSPLGAIALAGGWALWKGMFPGFDIREAVFGASLLLVAAMADLTIWFVKHRTAQLRWEEGLKESSAVEQQTDAALKERREAALKRRQDADKELALLEAQAPGSNR